MLLIPLMKNHKEYVLFAVLEDENIERIKQYDPAEFTHRKLPEPFKSAQLATVQICYATPTEIKDLWAFINSRNVEGIITVLTRGMQNPELHRKTVLSDDRRYRYTLWREWQQGMFEPKVGFVNFIGLNPSTADENDDDPTIRRCMGFARRWGYSAMCMTNLFAFRATNPREMWKVDDPIGPDNDRWLKTVSDDATMVIYAWGVHGTANDRRDRAVMNIVGSGAHCLRLTKGGRPEHPLYVPYSVTSQLYDKP
jgi:hypothetical protein